MGFMVDYVGSLSDTIGIPLVRDSEHDHNMLCTRPLTAEDVQSIRETRTHLDPPQVECELVIQNLPKMRAEDKEVRFLHTDVSKYE